MRNFWRALVQLGFHLLYYELAWSYDLVAWLVSMGQWRAWGRAALPYVVGQRVLEIGHGPGHLLRALHEAGYTAVGLDLSPQMGRLARKRTGGAVPLLRGRVEELPLATAVFHTVLATFPTEYVVDPATLAAVRRVLGENGRFLIIPAAQLNGQGLPQRFIAWLYTITGQRANQPTETAPDSAAAWQPYLDRFTAAGFRVDIQTIILPKSRVTLLIADVVRLEAPKDLGHTDSPEIRPPDTMRPGINPQKGILMTLEQENQADNPAAIQETPPTEIDEIQPATWGQRFIMIGIAALVILLDQWSKRLVEANIPYGSSWAPLEWLAPFFQLTHIGNTGATFGLFAGGGVIFTSIAAVVVVALLIYNLTLPAGQIGLRIALGLVLGGAIGNNLIDRLRLGHVTDFIHFSFWHIFNVADMAIVGGAILMGWLLWQEERAQKTRNSER